MASETEAGVTEGETSPYKVLVSDLPGDCTRDEIQTVFATYGEVLFLAMRPPGTDGLRSAVLVYDREQAALDAEELLDGKYSIRRDVDRPIRVQWQRADAKAEAPPASALPAAERARSEDPPAAAPAAAAAAPPENSRESPAWQEERGVPLGWMEEQEMGLQKFWTENGTLEAHKLWVGSLPPDITADELKIVFGTYGQVLRVHIMPTRHPKGKSAFILYSTRDAAEDAIEVLDETYKIRPNSPWPMQVRRANTTMPARMTGWSAYPGAPGDDWQDNWWSNSWADDWWGGWDGASDHRPGRGGYEESSWSGAGAKGRGKPCVVERPCPHCSTMVVFHCCEDCHRVNRSYERRSAAPYRDGGKGGSHGAGGESWEGGKAGKGGAGGAGAGGGEPWESGKAGKGGACGAGAGGGEPWEGGKSGKGGACGASAPAPTQPASEPGAAETEGSRQVHVYANLPGDIDEKALRWVFLKYGEVNDVKVLKDEANPGRAQAFIEFNDPYDAETSMMTLDGTYEIREGFGPIRLKYGRPEGQSAPY